MIPPYALLILEEEEKGKKGLYKRKKGVSILTLHTLFPFSIFQSLHPTLLFDGLYNHRLGARMLVKSLPPSQVIASTSPSKVSIS